MATGTIAKSEVYSTTTVSINTTYRYNSDFTIEKYGRIAILHIGPLKNLPKGEVALGTIPDGYRPMLGVSINTVATNTGTVQRYGFYVATNGSFTVYNYGAALTSAESTNDEIVYIAKG